MVTLGSANNAWLLDQKFLGTYDIWTDFMPKFITTSPIFHPIYLNMKFLLFAAAWIDLKGIMLSEVSRTEKDKYCMVSHIWRWKWKLFSLSNFLWPHGLYSQWNSPGQNTAVGSHSLLQGIFPIQGWTEVSSIAGRFITSWTTRDPITYMRNLKYTTN